MSEQGGGRLPRIFAPCAYSWNNKGDAALVIALVDTLRHELGDVDIVLTSFTPELDTQKYDLPFIAMPLRPNGPVISFFRNIAWKLRLKAIHPYLTVTQFAAFVCFIHVWVALHDRLGALALPLLPREVRTVVTAIQRCDLAVAAPGGYLMAPSLGDDYWLYHAAILLLITKLNKSVVLAPCSIGPFVGFHRKLARYVLGKCRHIYARERISLRIARELGVRADRVSLAPDMAFSLESHQDRSPRLGALLKAMSALPRPWVGVSVTYHHFPTSSDPCQAYENYVQAVADTIDRLQEVMGVSVVFVPQVIGAGRDDDLGISRSVFDLARNREGVVIIEEDLSPHDLIGLYEEFEMLIGTRMHANILALISGTPVVAIAYEHKTVGIMEMVGLGQCTISITEVKDRLWPVVQYLWANRNEVRAELPGRVEELGDRTSVFSRHIGAIVRSF